MDRLGIRKDYLLFVGTLEERKNLLPLLRAFEKIRKQRDLQLVLVGRPAYGYRRIADHIAERDLADEIVRPGYIAQSELIALYDAATVFIYPSLYEGFGIPLVEAMARGVPIVASRIPSTEEVAGDAA